MLAQHNPIIKAAKEAGAAYDNAAKAAAAAGGHSLGPLHSHIAMAVFESMIQILKDDEDLDPNMEISTDQVPSEVKYVITNDMKQDWARAFEAILNKDQNEVLRNILLFTVKDNYSKDDGPKVSRLSFSINTSETILIEAIEGTLRYCKAQEKHGPPPRGALERVLETQLRQMQTRRPS